MIRIITFFAVALLLVIAGCGWPGGLSPSYPAKDHDPKLTEYAESLAPIITAIEAFHDRNFRFPADANEILAELPNPDTEKDRWYYHVHDDGYSISIKLGWDPSLAYDSADGVWIFDPGDGSPEKQIELDVDIDP